jgi:hypothetical protein
MIRLHDSNELSDKQRDIQSAISKYNDSISDVTYETALKIQEEVEEMGTKNWKR